MHNCEKLSPKKYYLAEEQKVLLAEEQQEEYFFLALFKNKSSLVTPQWRQGPCFPMIFSFPHPQVKKNGSEKNPKKTNKEKQGRNKKEAVLLYK